MVFVLVWGFRVLGFAGVIGFVYVFGGGRGECGGCALWLCLL